MEIIRAGRLPGTLIHEAACYKCRCIVRFTQSEGTITSDQRDGDFVSVNCPTVGCGERLHSPLSSGR